MKSRSSWVIFDDDTVESVKESDIPKYFGDSNSGSAYVLFYQAVDIDPVALGLKRAEQPTQEPTSHASPVATPAFPPGLTHEGDSDTSEVVPGTPSNAFSTPNPTIISTPPAVTISIPPPEPSAPIPVPFATPVPSSPQVKTGFFSLRHSPSKPNVGFHNRTSLYASTSAPPVPPLPPMATSPKVTHEPSEASSSTASTLPVAPITNGQLKSPKEKTGGWFKRRSLRRTDDKSAKRHERPATSYEVRERHDGSSLTSSSTSSRLPLVSDKAEPSSVPLTETLTVHSDTSVSPDQRIPFNTATISRSPILSSTPTSPSSPTSHLRQISEHMHIPSHKKSQPVLSSAPSTTRTTSRPPKRPSTAGAAIQSPTKQTFSLSETAAPLPSIPRDLESPRERKDSLPALPSQTGRSDAVRQRNSIIASPPLSPPVQINTKRASRKMSFTGGMLSFTRKDKDKHKEKDPQGAISPPPANSLSPVPTQSFSMFGRI